MEYARRGWRWHVHLMISYDSLFFWMSCWLERGFRRSPSSLSVSISYCRSSLSKTTQADKQGQWPKQSNIIFTRDSMKPTSEDFAKSCHMGRVKVSARKKDGQGPQVTSSHKMLKLISWGPLLAKSWSPHTIKPRFQTKVLLWCVETPGEKWWCCDGNACVSM